MRYVCQICGYVYDDDKEQIPFDQLPAEWNCPLCGAGKSNFKAEAPVMQSQDSGFGASQSSPSGAGARQSSPSGAGIEQSVSSKAGAAQSQATGVGADEEVIQKLTAGQLAAVCSNLARGCEKQYKAEEARLFGELAAYFTSITPAVNDATVENVAKLLQEDIDNYPNVRATADQDKDRGAARVCVWGEKVTMMLSVLVGRYLKEGEKMLEGTDIWICTVCGFVYIGEQPPELCPVCKVPSYKFEKAEGRA